MKKWIRLLLLCMALALGTACASTASAPAAPNAAGANAKKEAVAFGAVVSQASSVPIKADDSRISYTNRDLGFSFQIPDSWESENYTVKPTEESVNGVSGQYPAVFFLFQADPKVPLLTIRIVPQDVWKTLSGKKGTSAEDTPVCLETKGKTVYFCTVAQTCPYDVGKKADLFNSMMLPNSSEDLKARFRLINSGQTAVAPESKPQ